MWPDQNRGASHKRRITIRNAHSDYKSTTLYKQGDRTVYIESSQASNYMNTTMGHNAASTAWPGIPISDEIKVLIGRFFSAVDDPCDKAGDTLADEVFTPDGFMVAAAGTATGAAGMRSNYPLCRHSEILIAICRDPQVSQKCMDCDQEAQTLCSESVHP